MLLSDFYGRSDVRDLGGGYESTLSKANELRKVGKLHAVSVVTSADGSVATLTGTCVGSAGADGAPAVNYQLEVKVGQPPGRLLVSRSCECAHYSGTLAKNAEGGEGTQRICKHLGALMLEALQPRAPVSAACGGVAAAATKPFVTMGAAPAATSASAAAAAASTSAASSAAIARSVAKTGGGKAPVGLPRPRQLPNFLGKPEPPAAGKRKQDAGCSGAGGASADAAASSGSTDLSLAISSSSAPAKPPKAARAPSIKAASVEGSATPIAKKPKGRPPNGRNGQPMRWDTERARWAEEDAVLGMDAAKQGSAETAAQAHSSVAPRPLTAADLSRIAKQTLVAGGLVDGFHMSQALPRRAPPVPAVAAAAPPPAPSGDEEVRHGESADPEVVSSTTGEDSAAASHSRAQVEVPVAIPAPAPQPPAAAPAAAPPAAAATARPPKDYFNSMLDDVFG